MLHGKKGHQVRKGHQARKGHQSKELSSARKGIKLTTILHAVNGLGGKGGEVWSEFAYMVNYLHATLNQTDIVVGSSADSSFWNSVSSP